jgi:hypothetical protein
MAVVLGTNCGFVTAAPTADPGGFAYSFTGYAWTQPVTAPEGIVAVREMGLWVSDVNGGNFDVGIYSNNEGFDTPNALIHVVRDVPASAGYNFWAVAGGLWWAGLVPGTKYHLGMQRHGTAFSDYSGAGTPTKYTSYLASEELPSPFLNGGTSNGTVIALYAVYTTAAAGPSIPVRINQFRRRR